jgi:hypothetical protein
VRWLVLMTGLIAGAQLAHAGEREVTITMATPASVQLTIWCGYGDKGCAQAAADAAQERCQKSRRDAQLSESDLIERELSGRQKFGYRFRCVN